MSKKVFAFIGPSGCGKDTLVRHILAKHPDKFHKVISRTSRPMREGEKDGVDYWFMDQTAMAAGIISDEWVELMAFTDLCWLYGTRYDDYSDNQVNILICDPHRLDILLIESGFDITIFYVNVPDNKRLIRQLDRETSPDIDEIFRRYKADREDFFDVTEAYPEAFWLSNSTVEDLERSTAIVLSELDRVSQ